VTSCRLIEPADAPALAELLRANRDFLAPFEPARRESYFTADGQQAAIGAALAEHEAGRTLPYVILGDDGSLAGRITLSGIVRGVFLSCSVGYWVNQDLNGRGVATAALREIRRVAFDELGLHRIQAETLVANIVALYRQAGAYLALPFFVVYSLMTLTESIAVVYNDMRWVIFVALAVKLALPLRRKPLAG